MPHGGSVDLLKNNHRGHLFLPSEYRPKMHISDTFATGKLAAMLQYAL